MITRGIKGDILTHAEVDNNFLELQSGIATANIAITSGVTEAKTYADTVSSTAVTTANSYTDTAIATAPFSTPSELEKIIEGANTGWRLLGSDPTYFGDIGNKAIDLSIGYVASTILGATGFNSFAIGQMTTASGMYTFAGGWDAISSGSTSFSYGKDTIASGDYSIALGSQAQALGESSIAVGEDSTTSVAAYTGVAMGLAVNAVNQSQSVFGKYNVGTSLDTIFEIGIGAWDARANGFEVYTDGTATLPGATIDEINARGTSAIPTKEYVDSSTIELQAGQLFAVNEIVSSDGISYNSFGMSVDTTDTHLIVGTPNDPLNATGGGVAYIYNKDGSGEVRLKSANQTDNDSYGMAVAISDTKAVVGAYFGDGAVAYSGVVYVYNLDGTGEVQIQASDGANSDFFGYSVATNGTKIAVGGQYDNGSGSVYLYNMDGTGEIKINAPVGSPGQFGISVAMNTDTLVVGASTNAGIAYTFDLNGNLLNTITASDGAASDFFGVSVGISDTKIVIGANGNDDLGSSSGSAYIYNIDGTGEVKLLAIDGAASDGYGKYCAISNDYVIVGSYLDDDGASGAGSAYLYNPDGSYIQKFNGERVNSSSYYGRPVSLSNTFMAIGAYGLTNVNGSNAGSVFTYDLAPLSLLETRLQSYTDTATAATLASANTYTDTAIANNPATTVLATLPAPGVVWFQKAVYSIADGIEYVCVANTVTPLDADCFWLAR